MPKVFVHGNPENSTLWTVLFDELTARGVKDLIALSPPGFGTPVPEGFEATRMGYQSWLIAELERLGGNVDLVGHDSLHVYGVLAVRPDLIRSWAADAAGTLAMCESTADVLGADVFYLEGLGHWWMFAGAPAAAEALVTHWERGSDAD